VDDEIAMTEIHRGPGALVLVIDADRQSALPTVGFLRLLGFDVVRFERDISALKALKAGEVQSPDVVIFDADGPKMQMPSACERLRDFSSAPIIVLSSSHSEADVVAALQNGADEYLAKPVSHAELAARLQAMLRRAGAQNGRRPADPLVAGDLYVSLSDHAVRRGGRKIDLSPIEFRLLSCLARDPGKLLSHRTLIARVWGPEYVECRHYLRLYIRYLREKLEDDPSNPKLVLSEWGMGYRLKLPGRSR
jgi:two-component system KDP operon response regulator KdpE